MSSGGPENRPLTTEGVIASRRFPPRGGKPREALIANRLAIKRVTPAFHTYSGAADAPATAGSSVDGPGWFRREESPPRAFVEKWKVKARAVTKRTRLNV